MQARQGDVMIESVSELPKNLKLFKRENGRIILAKSETTGHAHAICDEEVESFVDAEGNLYLNVEEETTVVHEKHATIRLPIGYYKVTRQREYSPESVRHVQD
jgi:hypothetical protein